MAAKVTEEQALEATKTLVRCANRRGHVIVDRPEELHPAVAPAELPMKPLANVRGNSKSKHFADVIWDWDGQVPKEEIATVLGKHTPKFDDLPEPFRLKEPCDIPYEMSLFVTSGEGGHHTVVKVVELSEKISKASIKQLCCGQAQHIEWAAFHGSNPHANVKAFQYMLEPHRWLPRSRLLTLHREPQGAGRGVRRGCN